ncbi:MAG: hypothetical protein IJO22_05330 [Oscillospiraceae bacterium]|nr:hypothetical protein [Oscillospiraceae bacterium]
MFFIKKLFAFLISAILLITAFAGCSNEPAEPGIPEDEPILEGPSEPENISEEPSEPERTPEEIAKDCGYMTFEEITAAGYYPDWMQPHTVIIYDENGVPTITEGGELVPDDLLGRPEFEPGVPFTSVGIEGSGMEIEPNTKAEYDLHGFIQNIYHLWPDGTYNLDYPPEEG